MKSNKYIINANKIIRFFNTNKIYQHFINNKIKQKEFKNVINDKKEYLIEGEYLLVNNRMTMAILKNNSEAKRFMEANTSHLLRTSTNKIELIKKYIRALIDFFFWVELKSNSNSKKKYDGSLVMLTGKGDIKIFDFYENKVITFLKEQNEYEDKKDIYFRFKTNFNIPKTSFNDIEKAAIEERIELIPFEELSYKVMDTSFERVLLDYKRYFNNIKDKDMKGYRIYEMLENLSCIKNEDFKDLLYSIVSRESDDILLPIVEVHGDLNYQNILIDKENMYYIDWEFSKPMIFYFDIFNLIFIEAATYSNYYYIDKYIKGDYDLLLYEIFNVFNLNYDINKKMLYLSIYLIDCMENKDPFVYEYDTTHVQLKYYTVMQNILKKV